MPRIKLRFRPSEHSGLVAGAEHHALRTSAFAGTLLDGRILPMPAHQHALDVVLSRVCANATQLRQHLADQADEEALHEALQAAEQAVIDLRIAIASPGWRLRSAS